MADPSALIAVIKYLPSTLEAIIKKGFNDEESDSIKIARRHLSEGNLEIAINCINDAIEKNKSDKKTCVSLYIMLSNAYKRQCDELIGLTDSHRAKTVRRGLSFEEALIARNKAIEALDNAIKLNPICGWAYLAKGIVYMDFLVFWRERDPEQYAEDYFEANRCYDNALAVSSDKEVQLEAYYWKAANCLLRDEKKHSNVTRAF